MCNFRLSRARRTSESAFGLIVNRFEIFRSPLRYDPDDSTTIILAACCLHNMLRSDSVGRASYTPSGSIDVEDVIAGTIREGDCPEMPCTGVARLQSVYCKRYPGEEKVVPFLWQRSEGH